MQDVNMGATLRSVFSSTLLMWFLCIHQFPFLKLAAFSHLERIFGTSEFLGGTSRPAGLKELYEGFWGG